MLRLRPAKLFEQEKIYKWFCLSSKESEYSFQKFQLEFPDFYYDPNYAAAAGVMILVEGDEELGCVIYGAYYLLPQSAELCVWLSKSDIKGKGFGNAALQLSMQYLSACYDIKQFMLRPSISQKSLLHILKKLGFISSEESNSISTLIHPKFLPDYSNPFLAQQDIVTYVYSKR